jgi:hypothetical protein
MSMLTDYFTKKNLKKQEGEFKKEMEYLANKPVFTLMDYKQRVEDELHKLKGRMINTIQKFAQNSIRTPRKMRSSSKWRRKL